MIKLNRGKCPEALTEEVKEELTKLYVENKDKDVWNCSKIKESLKESLLQMSYKKYSYCECILDIEAKDVTIDHFLPKSINKDKVVEWENLFPACLRCNRKKSDNEEIIVNPCFNEPKEFLALDSKNPYRLKGIDDEKIGQNTIKVIGLNDIVRVMVPRMSEWEAIHQRLEDIYEDLQEEGLKKKYKNRLEVLMEKCTMENAYSAVKSTNMLNDDIYFKIKEIMIVNNEWSYKFEQIEMEMKKIALKLM